MSEMSKQTNLQTLKEFIETVFSCNLTLLAIPLWEQTAELMLKRLKGSVKRFALRIRNLRIPYFYLLALLLIGIAWFYQSVECIRDYKEQY